MPPTLTSAVPTSPTSQTDWRWDLKQAIRDPSELCRVLQLPLEWSEQASAAARYFPLFAPRPFVHRIRPADVDDPLLRQVLPLAEETESAEGFTADPVNDLDARTGPGVIQKYQGRALLITTGACAVHCRYCFRRHYPYSESPSSLEGWLPALQQLSEDPTIDEVILSGGDPLTLVDATLEPLIDRIGQMPHLRRLRIHTRLPIMIPQRVTHRLLEMLSRAPLTVVVVVHVNHAQEIDDHVAHALDQLRERRLLLLNQAVLLRGVNDDLDSLIGLSETLLDVGVTPYYLNQLDRVAGAAHFEVPVERGRQLVTQLAGRLPGYAVPRYVQDVPGDDRKRLLL